MRKLLRHLATITLLILCLFLNCMPKPTSELDSPLQVNATWGGFNWSLPSDAQLVDTLGDSSLLSYTDTSSLIHVALTITNPSKDTVRFTSWSCSYEFSFVTDDTVNYKVQCRHDCYSNGPCEVILPPFSSTDRFLMLRWKPTNAGYESKLPTAPVKIGMINGDNIIWSNELDPERLDKSIYRVQ